jgi:hypothetical protein
MSTYEFDLDVLNKLTGTHIDIVNLPGGGIGLAAGLKLILDKGTGNVRDYYDSGNSRRVMTIGGSDALYLDAASLDILGRCIKNPKGLGGADGRAAVFADRYAGSDMGEKIQAAITALGATGGKVIVPPGSHFCSDAGSGYAVNMASKVVVEFLPGAILYANGDFAAFHFPTGISHAVLKNAYIDGNKVGNNTGVLFDTHAADCRVQDCYFYGLTQGVRCESWSAAPRNLVTGCKAQNCTYGFHLIGLGSWIKNCHAYLCTYGFRIGYYGSALGCTAHDCTSGFMTTHTTALLADCHSYSCTYGFRPGVSYASVVVTCLGCSSNDDNYGFRCECSSTGAYITVIRILGCSGRNSVTNFVWVVSDNVAHNLHLAVEGCAYEGTAGYSFKFYRSLKKLTYVNNYRGSRPEYWHPDLDRANFEIAHNYEG